MDLFRVKMKVKSLQTAAFFFVYFALSVEAYHNAAYVLDTPYSVVKPHIVGLDHMRLKRDVVANGTAAASVSDAASAPAPAPAAPSPAPAVAITPANSDTNSSTSVSTNKTDDSNRTTNNTKASSPSVAAVTQVPILGANGTGQRWPNMTDTTTKVSDPISPDDSGLPNVFETPEMVKADQNFSNLTYDTHDFYNSSFIGDLETFKQHWADITQPSATIHPMLSNSHRRATTVKLSFRFPFYGSWIQNITVATGGFIYTGEQTHAWLAATQYIAPFMANFDTSIGNDSSVKLADDGEKFTAFWENVRLREEPAKPFSFAVTLYKNGDIVFAYKSIPMHVQDIDDSSHTVKIGISDAYLTDKVLFYVRRKTIYEYHRVSFKNYEVVNNTILKLVPLPTCLQYDSCTKCINHNTSFQCAWCENIQKCSSGTDRNKQDWQLRNCDKSQILNASSCPAKEPAEQKPQNGTAYVTDTQGNPHHDAVINTLQQPTSNAQPAKADAGLSGSQEHQQATSGSHPALGDVVAALIAVTLVCGASAWTLYAFKNPHTRSGQLLIRYRPSQWNWRRGEARYTAATIHM